MAGMQWFYTKDGQQLGPVEFSEIERLHAAGEITGETLVWQQGTASWVKLGTLLGGVDGGPPPAVVPPLSTAPAAVAPATGAKTNVLAILSLVFGIIGLFCCILFAVAGIVCGHIAQGQLKTNPLETGKGLATAGTILGYVGIVVQVVWLIFYFTKYAALKQMAG